MASRPKMIRSKWLRLEYTYSSDFQKKSINRSPSKFFIFSINKVKPIIGLHATWNLGGDTKTIHLVYLIRTVNFSYQKGPNSPKFLNNRNKTTINRPPSPKLSENCAHKINFCFAIFKWHQYLISCGYEMTVL